MTLKRSHYPQTIPGSLKDPEALNASHAEAERSGQTKEILMNMERTDWVSKPTRSNQVFGYIVREEFVAQRGGMNTICEQVG